MSFSAKIGTAAINRDNLVVQAVGFFLVSGGGGESWYVPNKFESEG